MLREPELTIEMLPFAELAWNAYQKRVSTLRKQRVLGEIAADTYEAKRNAVDAAYFYGRREVVYARKYKA